MLSPRLVTVAHGTRDPAGTRLLEHLVRRVASRLPGVDVVGSYVELAEPAFASVMESATVPSVVVPLLLSTGHHLGHDVPAATERCRAPVTTAGPLGPHPLLADAAAAQLLAAGADRDDAVVMVVAGSKDPDAATQAVLASRMLQRQWGGPVRLGFLSGAGPRLSDQVARLRARGFGQVAVSPYLLAPGHFASRATEAARASGATAVADVLGAHPLVEELVVRRYYAALSRAA